MRDADFEKGVLPIWTMRCSIDKVEGREASPKRSTFMHSEAARFDGVLAMNWFRASLGHLIEAVRRKRIPLANAYETENAFYRTLSDPSKQKHQNSNRGVKYAFDRLVTRHNLVFAEGWISHPRLDVTRVYLDIDVANSTAAAVPAVFGRPSYRRYKTAERATFVVYGAWSGGAATQIYLCGELADGSSFRLPVSAVKLGRTSSASRRISERGFVPDFRELLGRLGGSKFLSKTRYGFLPRTSDPLSYYLIAERNKAGRNARAILIIDHEFRGDRISIATN